MFNFKPVEKKIKFGFKEKFQPKIIYSRKRIFGVRRLHSP